MNHRQRERWLLRRCIECGKARRKRIWLVSAEGHQQSFEAYCDPCLARISTTYKRRAASGQYAQA